MRHPEQALEIRCNEKLRTSFKKPKLLNCVPLCQERHNVPAVGFPWACGFFIHTPPHTPPILHLTLFWVILGGITYWVPNCISGRMKHSPIAGSIAEAGRQACQQIILDWTDLAILGVESVLTCSKTRAGMENRGHLGSSHWLYAGCV